MRAGLRTDDWRLTTALALALAVGACAPAPQTDKTPQPGSEMSRAVLDPYLKIQQALADDKMDGVTQ